MSKESMVDFDEARREWFAVCECYIVLCSCGKHQPGPRLVEKLGSGDFLGTTDYYGDFIIGPYRTYEEARNAAECSEYFAGTLP